MNQTRGMNSYVAAHMIAVEERRQADLAHVERMRFYREQGDGSSASGGSLGRSLLPVRRALGRALISVGELLGGAPAPAGQITGSAG